MVVRAPLCLEDTGITALHVAMERGMISLFELILTSEPLDTLASRDLKGDTLIHYASRCWRNPRDVVAWFSNGNEDLETLGRLVVGPFPYAILLGNYKAACAFFSWCCRHRVSIGGGRTAIHATIEPGRGLEREAEDKKEYRFLLIQDLVITGADPNAKINHPGWPDHGQTPICRAAYDKAPRYVYDALLGRHVQINAQPHMGRTALQ